MHPERCTAAVDLAMTVVMNESQIGDIVRAPVLLRNHVVDVQVFAVRAI
jgi:hypothetical protein